MPIQALLADNECDTKNKQTSRNLRGICVLSLPELQLLKAILWLHFNWFKSVGGQTGMWQMLFLKRD